MKKFEAVFVSDTYKSKCFAYISLAKNMHDMLNVGVLYNKKKEETQGDSGSYSLEQKILKTEPECLKWAEQFASDFFECNVSFKQEDPT